MLDQLEPILVVGDSLQASESTRAAVALVAHRYELLEASSIDEAVALLTAVHEQYPSVPIMVVSTQRTGQIRAAVAHSSAGLVPPSLHRSAIVGALRMLLMNELFESDRVNDDDHRAREETINIRHRIQSLTSQQKVVLGLIVRGKLNKQIAFELNVSMTTVKAHVSAILNKLGVQSRTQAVILVNKVHFVT
jgi:DNA-binding NarL/FixJ family response regulator